MMRLQGRPERARVPVVRGSATARLLRKLHPQIFPDQVDYHRNIAEASRKAERMGLVRLKPGRVLGAVWMDHYVSARRTVNLCGLCDTRYGKALLSRSYRRQPPWIVDIYSDCDGCGASTLKVTRYIPEETFFKSLIGAPSPKRIAGGSL